MECENLSLKFQNASDEEKIPTLLEMFENNIGKVHQAILITEYSIHKKAGVEEMVLLQMIIDDIKNSSFSLSNKINKLISYIIENKLL